MLLFASTIALSAFLLFLVQPIIAKQILPWFGGTSAVWTTCMVFFQVVLLAGYAYAHYVTRALQPRHQARLHIVLLAASLLALPIIPRESLKPAGDADAALHILLLLALTVGLPYFLLSSTGPLVQRWVAHRFPRKAVYRLFALSNLGSLIGLLAFPFAIEPFATSAVQSWVWSAAYAVFVLACAATAWRSAQGQVPVPSGAGVAAGAPPGTDPADPARDAAGDAAAADAGPPTAADYGLWLALAGLGSVMLLAATSHITQNIASVPFLWVVPLTLYLLTFVLAFEGRGGRGWYDPRWGVLAMLALAVLMAWGLSASRGVLDVVVAIPLYSVGILLACLFCHGELAQRKPAPRYLTNFYLMLSLGGALGGLFVGLVAPRVFPTYYELPLALVALCALALLLAWRHRGLSQAWSTSLGGTAAAALMATGWYGWTYADFLRGDVVVMQRNFYGTLRVREQGSGDQQIRRLLHGVILHGEQLTRDTQRIPGTYYARTSGVGLAISARKNAGPVRLGVVGLGVGTLSAYGRAGDTVRFYELDPDVLALARSHFGYLASCPAELQFVLGDARLSMEREAGAGQLQRYDVLAIDAFSSDSIPVHLITREAIDLYMKHVKPDGFVAIHISNRFLDLRPVLANIAQATGLAVRLVSDYPPDDSNASNSDWVLLTRDPASFTDPLLAGRVETIDANPAFSLWTDQFNNLLDVLKSNPLADLRALLARDD
jgi:hypothetical protein